jgi:hypothetical protein
MIQTAKQCAFAGTGGADDRNDFTLFNLEVDPFQYMKRMKAFM